VSAQGGNGGASSSGPGGNGGAATSTGSATGLTTANATVEAIGGNGVAGSRRGAAAALASTSGTAGSAATTATSGGRMITGLLTTGTAPTNGSTQSAARAQVPDPADVVAPAAPDASALAGFEAASYAVGLPRVIDSDAYLAGNPVSQPYFANIPGEDGVAGATSEVLGLVTLATGNRVYAATASFDVDLAQLVTPRQSLVLALLDTGVQGGGFDSLQFQVVRENVTVVNQTFATVAAANAFLSDSVINLGSNGVGNVSGSLDLDFSISLTTNDAGAGFAFDLLFGNATFESADFDGNGNVDGNDFLVWQRNVGVGTTLATGDADRDGDVDSADLTIWRNQYGFSSAATPTSGAVPEPAAAVLLLVGLGMLVRRRR
jgi:hypothetical protein